MEKDADEYILDIDCISENNYSLLDIYICDVVEVDTVDVDDEG